MASIGGRATGGPGAGSQVGSGTNNTNVSQREDLANFISMITRDETPFLSSIGKTKATAIYHEWQTDELEAPGNSRVTEGADYAAPASGSVADAAGDEFNPIGPFRTRLGNYTQINGKTIEVSGTRRAVDQAGVADEYAYQLKKRGTELRRDVEHDLIHNYNGASGSGIRQAGGVQAWLDTKTVELNGAALTAGNSGKGTHVPGLTADSSRVSLSLSQIDSVMQSIYEEGGKATKIMLSPKLRRDFSDLMVTDSGVRRNLDEKGKLRQSVDIYMSDFGDLMVVPNYIMGLSNTPTADSDSGRTAQNTADSFAFVYDPQWWSLATLRPLQEVDVGQKGDSTVGMMVEEFTLECKNPLGSGAIVNLK